MPITPFHLGIIIFGLLFFNYLYIPALIISGTIMDIEPIYYIFIAQDHQGSIHTFMHTLIGATLIALIVGFILMKLKNKIDSTLKPLKLSQKMVTPVWIYISSLFAAYSHIFLDSLMHNDIHPFWPFTEYNPIINLVSLSFLHIFLAILILLSIIYYLIITLRTNN